MLYSFLLTNSFETWANVKNTITADNIYSENLGQKIIRILKNASFNDLIPLYDDFVDIKFPDKETLKATSKSQAIVIIKGFFEQNMYNNFELISTKEISNVHYLTGKLQNNIQSLTITFVYKIVNREEKITAIRII